MGFFSFGKKKEDVAKDLPKMPQNSAAQPSISNLSAPENPLKPDIQMDSDVPLPPGKDSIAPPSMDTNELDVQIPDLPDFGSLSQPKVQEQLPEVSVPVNDTSNEQTEETTEVPSDVPTFPMLSETAPSDVPQFSETADEKPFSFATPSSFSEKKQESPVAFSMPSTDVEEHHDNHDDLSLPKFAHHIEEEKEQPPAKQSFIAAAQKVQVDVTKPIFCDVDVYKELLTNIELTKDEANQMHKFAKDMKQLHVDLDQKIDTFAQTMQIMYKKLGLVEQKLFDEE